jgi:predicted nucleic acid-binding protein
MSLVVDASLVVAALVDSGSAGRWAETQLAQGDLFAPHVMPFEVANVLRRLAAGGTISADVASLAHHDLITLPCELIGYPKLAGRTWALRGNLTSYDAGYVALAELLDIPLATLDAKLAAAPLATCVFRTPFSAS